MLSGPGHHATLVFKQSMNYFEPLYERLRKRQLVEELKVRNGCCNEFAGLLGRLVVYAYMLVTPNKVTVSCIVPGHKTLCIALHQTSRKWCNHCTSCCLLCVL